MMCLSGSLHRTITAEWFAECLRPGRETKRAPYLRAAATLVHAGAGRALDRAELVRAVDGQSSSTLYSLFGPRARDALRNRRPGGLLSVPGVRSAVDGLLVEVKVWSHWPYRQGWIEQLADTGGADRGFAAETLVRVLARWAADHPEVAAALDHAPPESAVEDLLQLCAGPVPGKLACGLLADVIRLAGDPAGRSPVAVLGTVQPELTDLLRGGSGPVVDLAAELVGELEGALAQLEYHLPRLSTQDRLRLTSAAAPRLSGALRWLQERG